jgi:hypothetical protein
MVEACERQRLVDAAARQKLIETFWAEKERG